MSNSIAHLVVADRILKRLPHLVGNESAYYFGALAPDTISSKPGCSRNDKKAVHLREDIPDVQWLQPEQMDIFQKRILQFVELHIHCAAADQRDFNIGYLVHLLTDQWNHQTIRQTMVRIAKEKGISESDREFYYMMVNDLEALDQYLLKKNPDIAELFQEMTDGKVMYCLPGVIEKEYLEGSLQWWKSRYIPCIQTRECLYIQERDIDDFVSVAAEEISKVLSEMIQQ